MNDGIWFLFALYHVCSMLTPFFVDIHSTLYTVLSNIFYTRVEELLTLTIMPAVISIVFGQRSQSDDVL